MAVYCARTGETHCKCLPQRKLEDICAMKVEVKSVLRKLFTDHAVYTAFVLKSLVSGLDDVTVMVPRLLQNQKDIGDQLKSIVGGQAGNNISILLREHIELAAAVITSAVKGDPQLENNKMMLFANSDRVAAALTALNPARLPFDVTQEMFRIHNEFLIEMVLSRIAKNYSEEQKLYDAYYNEILEMSDAIANAL